MKFQIDSKNKAYNETLINLKDTLLSTNNELALHFKKHLTKKDLNNIVLGKRQDGVSLSFSLNKKKKIVNAKTNISNERINSKLVSIFKKIPFEKLKINSDDILLSYSFNIIKNINGNNVILCSKVVRTMKQPMFKSCESSKNPQELTKCTSNILSTFIIGEFNTALRNKTDLTGKIRINCIFRIDVDGSVVDVKVKAPNPHLANEAEKILKKLPKAISPGYSNGKVIKFPYSLPIIFDIPEITQKRSVNDIPR